MCGSVEQGWKGVVHREILCASVAATLVHRAARKQRGACSAHQHVWRCLDDLGSARPPASTPSAPVQAGRHVPRHTVGLDPSSHLLTLQVTSRGAKVKPLGKGQEAWMVTLAEVASRTEVGGVGRDPRAHTVCAAYGMVQWGGGEQTAPWPGADGARAWQVLPWWCWW